MERFTGFGLAGTSRHRSSLAAGVGGRDLLPNRGSVRALILALARFEIASRDQTRALEKEWAAYRKQHRLDVEGQASAGVAESCRH
jgi:hypothetical protein